nr:hypothetical protein [Aeromicrobium ginsengisoli]
MPIAAVAHPTAAGRRRMTSWWRMMLREIDIIGSDIPCSTRPTSSTARFGARAQTTEPTIRSQMQMTNTRRLPNMSASRPATGLATAPVRKKPVATHDVLDGLVPSSPGSTGMRGMTTLKIMHTSRLALAGAATSAWRGRSSGGADTGATAAMTSSQRAGLTVPANCSCCKSLQR